MIEVSKRHLGLCGLLWTFLITVSVRATKARVLHSSSAPPTTASEFSEVDSYFFLSDGRRMLKGWRYRQPPKTALEWSGVYMDMQKSLI